MYANLAILAIFAFAYSLVSGRVERTPFNGALMFALFGFLMGPHCFRLLVTDLNTGNLSTMAELTLAMVLFTEASNARLGILRRSIAIPERMLLVGLPLTILLGIGAGILFFPGLSFYEIALIAVMLAPTDAALGKAVITNKSVPARIREGLNVESGLNDGICVPVLFIFLALATHVHTEGGTTMMALHFLAEELGIGIAVGGVLTFAAVRLITFFEKRGWVSETWHQITVPALAFACFCTAQAVGGSGFIAAFVGGLLFGHLEKNHKHKLLLAAEGIGDSMALITWVIYGCIIVGNPVRDLTWQIFVYALLSLTVIRMLPVYLSLTGVRIPTKEKLFAGWFGPRGLASIVFAVIILKKQLPGSNTIGVTAATVIGWSVLLHGITANPLARRLGKKLR